MTSEQSVFEKTISDYLAQVARKDKQFVEERLGVSMKGSDVIIPFLKSVYRMSESYILDQDGREPSFDLCVVLCKYILLCPEHDPEGEGWVAYRDFRDSGPLTVYFKNDVEDAISEHYKGRVGHLMESSRKLGGYPPAIELPYDLSMQFDLLPRIPILMLFNDMDDEFPGTCSVLYELRAERYLDAECLAMAGRLFFAFLKDAIQAEP